MNITLQERFSKGEKERKKTRRIEQNRPLRGEMKGNQTKTPEKIKTVFSKMR